MHLPVPAFFRRLDRHLLLNYPILWILRLHYVLAAWLAGLALIVTVALTVPIRISTVLPVERPCWLILGAIALLAPPWMYRLARLSPALRHDPRPRTGVLLLVAYLGFSALFLFWPVAFYWIFEPRIANAVTPADEALLRQTPNTSFPRPEFEPLLRRFGKGSGPDDPPTLGIRADGRFAFTNQDSEFLLVLGALKRTRVLLQPVKTPQVFRDPVWALALVQLVLLSHIAQIVRREQFLGFLAAFLALSLAVAASFQPRNLAFVLLAYLALGAGAMFWGDGNRRRLNVPLMHLVAMFYFLLPCSVFFTETTGLFGAPPSSPQEAFQALAFGLALLFALAPFVQRRLFALAAAPR